MIYEFYCNKEIDDIVEPYDIEVRLSMDNLWSTPYAEYDFEYNLPNDYLEHFCLIAHDENDESHFTLISLWNGEAVEVNLDEDEDIDNYLTNKGFYYYFDSYMENEEGLGLDRIVERLEQYLWKECKRTVENYVEQEYHAYWN